MGHYNIGGGYDDAGELFAHYLNTPMTIKHVAGAGSFHQQYHLGPIKLDGTFEALTQHVSAEFWRRLQALEKQPGPIVVKAFAHTDFFTMFSARFVEVLFDKADVIVLHRRDGLKALLSTAICAQLNAWHPPPEQLQSAKDVARALRFEVSEFFARDFISGLNLLHLVTQNLDKFSSTAKVIYYEDFCTDPVNQLNALLGTNFQYTPHMTKFIEQHEQHVTNLDRIKELYRKYSLSQ